MAVNVMDLLSFDESLSEKVFNTCRIGLEQGQRKWEATFNCPQEILVNTGVSSYQRWTGPLDVVQRQALESISRIAEEAQAHGYLTNVIFEAGGFGQSFGRDLYRNMALPWQIVARNIEYVRYGKPQRALEKDDRIDTERLAHLDLTHPQLPYADILAEEQEERRGMLAERRQLTTTIHRANSRICALFRTRGIDTKHRGQSTWRSFLDKHDQHLPAHFCRRVNNRIAELELAEQAREDLRKAMNAESERQRSVSPLEPPGNIPGKHPLQPLGPDSPLREHTVTDAISRIRGFGIHTARMIDWTTVNPQSFKNHKAWRKYCGLAPCNRNSCTIKKSAGMTEGRPWLRSLMIEAAWNWLRYQGESHLAKKYAPRINGASRRARKIAICALAGELSEAIYKYLVHGKPITGVILKS